MKTLAARWCIALALSLPLAGFADATEYRTRIIERGSELGAIDSLDFDQDGNLWATSISAGLIYKMTPRARVLETFDAADGVDGLLVDLVVGPDNLIYFIEFGGKIKRINADGSIQLIADTIPAGIFTLGGLAFSRDNRLFISAFAPDLIAEIDVNGINPPRIMINNPGNINQFGFGPDNMLYGPQSFGTEVVKIDVDAGTLQPVVGGLSGPIAVKFDRMDRLHIVEDTGMQIIRVDLLTGQKTVVAQTPRSTDTLTFNQNNRLYYGTAGDGLIARVTRRGRSIPLTRTGMILPGGVDVERTGFFSEKVTVADFFGAWTFRGLTGRQLARYPGSLPGAPGVGFPSSIDIDDNGVFLLSSFFFGLVQTFDPADESSAIVGAFPAPLDAVNFQGDRAVAELASGSVIRLSDGAILGATPVPTALYAQGGDLWVSDVVLGTVTQIVDDGTILSPGVPIATGLAAPEGFAISDDGLTLYVVEVGTKSLAKIDILTGQKETIASDLAVGNPNPVGLPPTGLAISDVAIGAAGTLYVTGDADRVLYRIRPRLFHQL